MRYMVERNFVRVWGHIWMPNTLAAYEYTLSPYDVENIGEFTRENVEGWLHKNAGDFQSIEDFFATVGDKEIPWEKEENEFAYFDAVYGEEEEVEAT